MPKFLIDINCDLGEGTEPSHLARDAEIMQFISSCNIACGGHAGNVQSMSTSITNAKKYKLNIGVHPSFPDTEDFGRKALSMSSFDLRQSIREQLNVFVAHCIKLNVNIHHVKPHGALYNLAAIDLQIALIIAEETASISKDLLLIGLANSSMKEAANIVGIKFWAEGFMDRYYHNTGLLLSRENKLAVHTDTDQSIKQALDLSCGNAIQTFEGDSIALSVDTICLHGDHDNSLSLAKSLYQSLQQQNLIIN